MLLGRTLQAGPTREMAGRSFQSWARLLHLGGPRGQGVHSTSHERRRHQASWTSCKPRDETSHLPQALILRNPLPDEAGPGNVLCFPGSSLTSSTSLARGGHCHLFGKSVGTVKSLSDDGLTGFCYDTSHQADGRCGPAVVLLADNQSSVTFILAPFSTHSSISFPEAYF